MAQSMVHDAMDVTYERARRYFFRRALCSGSHAITVP